MLQGGNYRDQCGYTFLTPEPNGVGEGVYEIVRVLRRRRRRRDGICVWTPEELGSPNFDTLSILSLSLIIQKMTSLVTSGRVQNRDLIKIVTIFEIFFEIYEPTNSKLAAKVDLSKIYAQSGYDVTSHFWSASSQYPLQCKQTEYRTSGLMYC